MSLGALTPSEFAAIKREQTTPPQEAKQPADSTYEWREIGGQATILMLLQRLLYASTECNVRPSHPYSQTFRNERIETIRGRDNDYDPLRKSLVP
jgi:hypothetical protein